MFKKLATIGPFLVGRASPAWTVAFNNIPSNDNRPGFRRPAGQRARPKLALDCHWVEVNGLLECRWTVAGNDAPQNDAKPRPSGAFVPAGRLARSAA